MNLRHRKSPQAETSLTPEKLDRLRLVAERAFRSKHNETEAEQALKIFDKLCNTWDVSAEERNAIWRELEGRYPELDRRKALKRMGRLLREYVRRHKATAEWLEWKPWSEEKLEPGVMKLVEHADLRACKYLLSLKPDEFKSLYLERAKIKAQETSRKKDGSPKEVKEKDVDKLVAADMQYIREMCVDFIKGKGIVQRKYTFKAPKTFGRRFTRGLQGVWGAFKCVLTQGRPLMPGLLDMPALCTDFDQENAHPVILLWVCSNLGIECSKLRHYVQNRDKVLTDMIYATGRPRQFCKEQFLIATNESRPIYRSPFSFLNEYDLEMKSIHAALVSHAEYQWVREYVSDKESNYNGSFVNLILCYWENILLEYAVQYFQSCKVDVNVLMFDGLMVSKVIDDRSIWHGRIGELNEGECEWHCRMLNEICKHVLGIDMKWHTKPLSDKRVVVPDDFDPETLMLIFEEIVPEFNKTNVKVGENYVTVNNRDGTFSIRTKEKFKDYHNHIGCMKTSGQRERFVYKWLDDYDDIPYKEQAREYPPGGPADRSVCPEDHLNVWVPFDFQRWDEHENPDGTPFKYNPRAVELFKDMVMGLVGDVEEHFTFWMQWNYTNLMHPATKSGRCPFIISKQGVGKDTLVMILQKIFGYARCVTESDPSENIWGKFNEVLQSSYLIILTEVGIGDFMQGLGRVKHLITQYEYTLNLKGGAKVKKMSSFHRFLGITNIGSQGEITPVPVTDDERRFILFSSSMRLKGKVAFWKEMYSLIDDWSAIRSILQYMLTFEHGPMFDDTEVPVTDFQKTAVSTHPILQWLKEYVNETDFEGEATIPCDDLWNEYRAWCTNSNVQLGNMTKDQFGKKLTRFNIPGLSQSKSVKECGKVERRRPVNYTLIREHFKDEDKDEDAGPVESEGVAEPSVERDASEVEDVPVREESGEAVAKDAAPESAGPSQVRFGGLGHKRKGERLDMFAETKRQARRVDEECKNVDIRDFCSAGVMLYNARGYWLGFERTNGKRVWTDYGGQRKGNETPWETAVRECKEEAGVDISECRLQRPPDFNSESKSKHVLFWVETKLEPIQGYHPDFLNHSQFTSWPENELHPRLLYDKGYIIKTTREKLGFPGVDSW